MSGGLNKSQSEGSLSFLKNSKVGSATGFRVVAGSLMATPHGKSRRQDNAPRFVESSESQKQFKEVPHCYASMSKKPLMPYHPNATRSRLAVEDAPVPLKNASAIEFRDPHCVHKRRFMTTNKNHFTGEQADLRSNLLIIGEHTRVKRMLSEK